MNEWWPSIHWPAASDQNSSLDNAVERATVATSPIPTTMPTISMARGGIRLCVDASGGSARAGAAPVVGTSKVSTTRALACTAPPPTGPPPASLRAPYNAPPDGGVAGRLRSCRFVQPIGDQLGPPVRDAARPVRDSDGLPSRSRRVA